jgi:hypothetical protein
MLFGQFLHEGHRQRNLSFPASSYNFVKHQKTPSLALLYIGLQDSAVSLSPRNRSVRDRGTGTTDLKVMSNGSGGGRKVVSIDPF